MYRLVLWFLVVLLLISAVLGMFGVLSYNPWSIVFSSVFLVAVSLVINSIFSRTFSAPTNVESVYITALILALIMTPARGYGDLIYLAWAAILSTAVKYILAIKSKHLFNPAAAAVILTSIGLNQSASWWVGNSYLLPAVIIGGLLIVRKIRREDMVFTFIIVALLTISAYTLASGHNFTQAIRDMVLSSSMFFFAFIMLTELLTTPPVKRLQIVYAGIIGILFAPQFHIANFYTTPEIALVLGNIFSYLVSPKEKLVLSLSEKIMTAPDTYDFVFNLKQKINFSPGQYMEWTLPHMSVDSRGNRRYFTLASSPTENNVRLGIKFNHPGSSFKNALLKMDRSDSIAGSQRAGDFTLPANKTEKLVFIAGGIGITPFRSMLKYLIDINEKRDVVLFYSNKTPEEIVYNDVFTEAGQKLGIKTVYTITDTKSVPVGWTGEIGRLNSDMLKRTVPDYLSRKFYLSGPHNLVTSFEEILKNMGVKDTRIVIDFFPGFV
jgi:ferredoxin-NADP reductase